ncbi:MAG: hypothetical protein KJ062_16650, partial [Thermoanaerobaculia bacterium]|nr:hypothetical protein [Thermoanaerobaculia bacterium]
MVTFRRVLKDPCERGIGARAEMVRRAHASPQADADSGVFSDPAVSPGTGTDSTPGQDATRE